jgi:SAM-dependent MidA family methyltransferase
MAEHTAFMNHLSQLIKEQGGWLSFADYMQQALYHPQFGYYEQQGHFIGATQGDFVTAPMLGPLFAWACVDLARSVWDRVGCREVLEFGPGTGQLALDFLLRAESLGVAPSRYWLCEVSRTLRAKQQQLLSQKLPASLFSRISWCDYDDLPHFSGVMLANEVLDAFPATLFRVAGSEFYERGVVMHEGQLAWEDRHFSEESAFIQQVKHYEVDWPNGMESEVHLGFGSWFQKIANSLQQGCCLMVDYGYPRAHYYQAQRLRGTLMSHRGHHKGADPLLEPGLWDLTAHVDFTAVVEHAAAVGLDLGFYATQAGWLQASALSEHYQQALGQGWDKLALDRSLKMMLLPSHMGEVFRTMVVHRGCEGLFQHFSATDQSFFL